MRSCPYSPPNVARAFGRNLSEGWSHLVCKSSRRNNNIGLSGRSTEHNSISVHVVSWGGNVHHLHSATGQSKSQRPQRAFSAPVDQVVDPGESPLNLVLLEVHLERRVAMALNSVRNA